MSWEGGYANSSYNISSLPIKKRHVTPWNYLLGKKNNQPVHTHTHWHMMDSHAAHKAHRRWKGSIAQTALWGLFTSQRGSFTPTL